MGFKKKGKLNIVLRGNRCAHHITQPKTWRHAIRQNKNHEPTNTYMYEPWVKKVKLVNIYYIGGQNRISELQSNVNSEKF